MIKLRGRFVSPVIILNMAKAKLKLINDTMFFVRYVDAAYAFKKLKKLPDPIYQALGKKVYSTKNNVTISFCCDAHGAPLEGLVIPKRALVEEAQKSMIEKKLKSLQIKTRLSIEWEDIIRFRNGFIPKTLTRVYTEGILHGITNGMVVVDDPESIIFSYGQPPRNHPDKKPARYYIPLKLITSIKSV